MVGNRAMSGALMMVVMVITAAVGADCGHQSPAPSPGPDCSSVLFSLADCLTFVQNGSTARKPSASCCSGLKKVVLQTPGCLCEMMRYSGSFGIALNTTRALLLPAACFVAAPPFSACSHGGSPAATPAPASQQPSSPKASPPATALSPSAAPASPAPSGASSSTVSSLVLFALLALVLLSYH